MMGTRLFGIDWAPLNVPLERRLQTLSVSVIWILVFSSCTTIPILFYFLFTRLYWITLLYIGWWLYSRNVSSSGGMRLEWLRNAALQRKVRDYFPLTLVKTADLDPQQKYIIGYHPHGVMPFGLFNFISDVTGFRRYFPGINPFFLSLRFGHFLPVFREFAMAAGCCDVSKESIDHILQATRNAAVIVIGGAREINHTGSGCVRLVLNKRKGFIKMALKHGAHLVPSFTFGENEHFRILKPHSDSPFFRKLWRPLRRWLGEFTYTVFMGRGWFNYSYGLLPLRHPVTTVVGRPIIVKQDGNPSEKAIADLHARYVNDLNELFEEYKEKYGYGSRAIEFIA